MLASPTLFCNALNYVGSDDPRVGNVERPAGLKGTHNRIYWASWEHVEKKPGVYDFDLADLCIQRNIAQGLTPIVWIAFDPEWHKATRGTPEHLAAFGEFFRPLVKRNAGKGLIYETGNETDGDAAYWPGSPEAAGAVYALAHQIVDEIDPTATVLLCSVQALAKGGNGLHHLGRMLRSLPDGLRVADAAVHTYVAQSPGLKWATKGEVPLVDEWLRNVEGVLREHGHEGARVWVTESGVDGFSDMAEADQQAYLRAMLLRHKAGGAYASLPWAMDDGSGYGFKDRAALQRCWNAASKNI